MPQKTLSFAGFAFVAIAAATGVIRGAAAGEPATYSGNDLLESCRLAATEPPVVSGSLQMGICVGQIEALNWLAPGQYDEKLRACTPASTTRQQMAKVVVAYLEKNRDRLIEPFEGLALEALAATWPCERKPGWFENWFKGTKGPD